MLTEGLYPVLTIHRKSTILVFLNRLDVRKITIRRIPETIHHLSKWKHTCTDDNSTQESTFVVRSIVNSVYSDGSGLATLFNSLKTADFQERAPPDPFRNWYIPDKYYKQRAITWKTPLYSEIRRRWAEWSLSSHLVTTPPIYNKTVARLITRSTRAKVAWLRSISRGGYPWLAHLHDIILTK